MTRLEDPGVIPALTEHMLIDAPLRASVGPALPGRAAPWGESGRLGFIDGIDNRRPGPQGYAHALGPPFRGLLEVLVGSLFEPARRIKFGLHPGESQATPRIYQLA